MERRRGKMGKAYFVVHLFFTSNEKRKHGTGSPQDTEFVSATATTTTTTPTATATATRTATPTTFPTTTTTTTTNTTTSTSTATATATTADIKIQWALAERASLRLGAYTRFVNLTLSLSLAVFFLEFWTG